MAKRIEFDASDSKSQDRFQFIYQGFVMGAPEGGVKGIENTRRAFKIMEKLEAISEEVKTKPQDGSEPQVIRFNTGDPMRTLREAAEGEKLQMVLDDAEVSTIRSYMNNVGWRPAMCKGHVDADEFLDKAPEAN